MFRSLRKNLEVGRVTRPYPEKRGPESGKAIGAPVIDVSKCTGCGKCVLACPTGALRIEDHPAEKGKRDLRLFSGECVFCGLCEPSCPHQAIAPAPHSGFSAGSKEGLLKTLSFDLSKCREDAAFLAEKELPAKKIPDLTPRYSGGDFFKELSLDDRGEKLREKIKKLFGRSLHIREVDAGSCNGCEVEAVNLSNPVYDAERFGIHFVASPRHADLLLVTGPVSRHMELALVKTYNATPFPRLVVACGSCAVSGGLFGGSYAVVGAVDKVVPVDVYVPGCPPHPEEILCGIFLALDRFKT